MNIRKFREVLFCDRGYTNQFIVRTKHPIALRYNDISVLENHHLAAAFTVINKEENNILENIDIDRYQEMRKSIINIVLNTDFSKHFEILTELKTKLGGNFPTEAIEDRIVSNPNLTFPVNNHNNPPPLRRIQDRPSNNDLLKMDGVDV